MGTGLVTGGVMSINADPTKFDITAGSGYIVDNHTDPAVPVVTKVTWGAFTAVVAPWLATDLVQNIAINAAGAVVQQLAAFTIAETRDYIIIGRLAGNLSAITFATTAPRVLFNVALDADDLAASLGQVNIGGGNVFSANGANLNVNKSSGEVYRTGANYSADRKSPNIVPSAALVAPTFLRTYRNGAGGFINVSTTVTDQNFYDNGTGTLAAVATNKWTVQRIYLAASATATRAVFVYGQAVYNSLGLAKDGIATEAVVINASLNDTLLRGWLLVRNGCTDLSDTNEALFIAAGKLGDTGSGGAGSIAGADLTIYQSSVAAAEVSGLTETTIATVTVPTLGANDMVEFGAVFTRPASQVGNTLLNVYLGGSLIAVHTLDVAPFAVIPRQHLFSNRNDPAIQLGCSDAAGVLMTGSVDTTAASTLVLKIQNGDAGDATTLQSLTVKLVRG